jgi:hypothetical protein
VLEDQLTGNEHEHKENYKRALLEVQVHHLPEWTENDEETPCEKHRRTIPPSIWLDPLGPLAADLLSIYLV